MERKQIYNEVETILNDYCNGCFLYKHNRKDMGRNYAHRFCITSCTIGARIQKIGDRLIR